MIQVAFNLRIKKLPKYLYQKEACFFSEVVIYKKPPEDNSQRSHQQGLL